jgi:circadian clock protein KaiB
MKRDAMFKFRLYVADNAQNGALAITNLKALCRAYLPGRYEIEVVDVLLKPQRALTDGIYMTPTLIKLAPLPVIKIVGTLGQTQAVLLALGLESLAV